MNVCGLDPSHLNLLLGPQKVRIGLHIGDAVSSRHVHQLRKSFLVLINPLKVLNTTVFRDLDRKLMQVVLMVAHQALGLLILKKKVVLIDDTSRKLVVRTPIPATNFAALSADDNAIILNINHFAVFDLLEPILGEDRLAVGPIT